MVIGIMMVIGITILRMIPSKFETWFEVSQIKKNKRINKNEQTK